ncbi:hypothetical protein TNCV_3737151 [Trichonephila clavipes]|nr:hypothetical protein TNCV_3737151 [Trichonephila clavipes]
MASGHSLPQVNLSVQGGTLGTSHRLTKPHACWSAEVGPKSRLDPWQGETRPKRHAGSRVIPNGSPLDSQKSKEYYFHIHRHVYYRDLKDQEPWKAMRNSGHWGSNPKEPGECRGCCPLSPNYQT